MGKPLGSATGLRGTAKLGTGQEVYATTVDGSFRHGPASIWRRPNRFGATSIARDRKHYLGMNPIRLRGRLAKYGERPRQRGQTLGDVPSAVRKDVGGYGEEVRDPAKIAPALRRGAVGCQERRSAVTTSGSTARVPPPAPKRRHVQVSSR